MNDALSSSVLKAAFRSVVLQNDFVDKIRWWLICPHAAERWLQFELAYRLNCLYDEKFVAACETDKWADIAVFSPPSAFPLWNSENKPVAKLELKMLGNWWISNHEINGIKSDIQKVEGYDQPSAAIVFTTVFRAPADNVQHKALMDQVAACKTARFEDVQRRLDSLNLLHIDQVAVPAEAAKGLDFLAFHMLAYPNTPAKPLFDDLGAPE
jgi:hypothetical protein